MLTENQKHLTELVKSWQSIAVGKLPWQLTTKQADALTWYTP